MQRISNNDKESMELLGPNRAFARPVPLFFDQIGAVVHEASVMMLAL